VFANALFIKDDLLAFMEDIGGRLEFFQQLDHATRMLNHPGESLIFQVDFLDMVNRVDICIEFLKFHVRTFGVASKSFVFIIFVATLATRPHHGP
jgi:hypothetical protein